RLGLKTQIENMGFDGLYDSLKTSQVDALISALSIDPTKIGFVQYTRSYIDAGQILASRGGNFQQMEDLDGHSLAVEYGSIGDELARRWQPRWHVLKPARFTPADEAMNAASTGGADAVLVDSITARLYVRSHPSLLLSPALVSHDPYAVAVRLTSYDLA